MAAKKEGEPASGKNPTKMERVSDRELVVRRVVNGPARMVFEAWTNPDLFKRWWTPKSFGLTIVSCEIDARTGGGYRLAIRPPGAEHAMEFFGNYIEVTPHSRIVWTNEEGGQAGPITTVTFEEKGGQTVVVMRELYPSKKALDDDVASGSKDCLGETFEQLDGILAVMG